MHRRLARHGQDLPRESGPPGAYDPAQFGGQHLLRPGPDVARAAAEIGDDAFFGWAVVAGGATAGP